MKFRVIRCLVMRGQNPCDSCPEYTKPFAFSACSEDGCKKLHDYNEVIKHFRFVYSTAKPVTAEMLTELVKEFIHKGPNFMAGHDVGEYILKQLEGK